MTKSGFNDDGFNDEMDDVEIVTLKDTTGRSISCTVEHAIELEGEEYVLLLPVDAPVEIFSWQEAGDDEEATPVEDEAEIDRLFPVAKAVLEEHNLTLKRSAVTLTVEGDLPDYIEEDFLEEESDDEEEELQFLASFYSEEQEYGVYAPLDPFFILARLDDHNVPQLLTPEELEKLEPLLPMIEDELLNQLDED
jgi:hypothetical protein